MLSKLSLLLYTIAVLLLGCASSNDQSTPDERYPNLVELMPEEGVGVQPASIYIDSVKLIDYQREPVLLVKGNFPDGCIHIGGADHQLSDGYPSITITAWKNTEAICTQALVPFSFIYRQLPGEYVTSLDSIFVNNNLYPVNY